MTKNSKPNSQADLEDLKHSKSHSFSSKSKKTDETDHKTTEKNSQEEFSQGILKYLEESEKQIESLKDEINQWKEKTARLSNEIRSIQNHHEIENQRIQKVARQKILQTLSPFLNTLYLAFSYLPETDEEKIQKFFETLKYSFKSLLKDLEANQIELIVPKEGAEIDPVIMNVLNPGSGSLTVKQTVSIGFRIDGLVLTPAQVMI